jgi:hypothetical protein
MFLKYGYLASEQFLGAVKTLTKIPFTAEDSVSILHLCQDIDKEIKCCLEKLKEIEDQHLEEAEDMKLRAELSESESKITAVLDFEIMSGASIAPEALAILKPLFTSFPEIKDPQTDLP